MTAVAARDTDVTTKRRSWRGKVFPVWAGLLALVGWLLLDGVVEGLSPWWLIPDYDPTPELHRWHYAEHGARIAILLSGSLLALLWRPRDKPVLLQFYALGWAAMLIGYVGLSGTEDLGANIGFGVVVTVVVSTLFLAYPARHALFDFTREGPFSRPLLSLAAAMTALLTPVTIQKAHQQLTVAGEHADMGGGASGVALNLMLVFAAFLVVSKRPGWQTLGTIVGIALVYLSAAAFTVPDHEGSWGIVGGILALIGGLGFIGATVWEGRQHSVVRAPEPVAAGADG